MKYNNPNPEMSWLFLNRWRNNEQPLLHPGILKEFESHHHPHPCYENNGFSNSRAKAICFRKTSFCISGSEIFRK